eukprot:TRINITY_DN3686_c0_g1_i1.p1 TRINITY_DN3686_c0_g1~~TRINITY_DN3686_c0_g1_i1.p1  ORF type:complete len:341 (+),score=151.92 TRINITY_DN3686_c0_g1_i1:640-1662(+)
MATVHAVVSTGIGAAKDVLQEKEIATPAVSGERDLVVRVKAVSVNPIDFKVRAGLLGPGERVLGYDASGVVEAVGSGVQLFAVGDEVFYAGDVTRPGSNSALHVVDERIVGRKPKNVSHGEAAAVPLVALTAWEGMLEGAGIAEDKAANAGKVMLVVAGAGGVGSMVIQLAKKVLGLTVVASASRPETAEFVKKMGADHVINHHKAYKEELAAHGLSGVDYVFNGIDLDLNFDQLVEVLNSCGKIIAITAGSNPEKIDATKLFFPKRGSLVWELMFARAMSGNEPERQHAILDRVAALIEGGELVSAVTHTDAFSAQALIAAHERQESGKMIGKSVLTLE